MQIKEIDVEKNVLVDKNGNEYQIPDGCHGMTKEEIQHHIDVATEFIENFIEENGYGKIVDVR